MRILIKMTLPIGINRRISPAFQQTKSGFTFIEVMVTLIVISVGLTAIFKTLFYSLDQLNYLTNRLYVSNLIEDRLSQVQKTFKLYQIVPMDQSDSLILDVKSGTMHIDQKTHISAVDNLIGTLKVDLTLTWDEKGRKVTLKRSAYMSSLGDPSQL